MDDILKSEIFIVVYEQKDGVSFEEFGGLFRQIHGYYLNLSKYGYSSLRSLLNDMKDLVEIKITKGHQMIRCKSPSRHHVVVSHGNMVPGLSSALPSSGPSPDPVVRKTDQEQLTQNRVKVNSTNSATGKKDKEKPKHTCSPPVKNTSPAVNHKNSPLPVKCGITSNVKTATNNMTTNSSSFCLQVNSTNSASGETSKEKPKPSCNIPSKNTNPAVNDKKRPLPVKWGIRSNEKTATKNKTTNSSSFSLQVNSTNSASGTISKEKPKPSCNIPSKNTNPAVNLKNSPQLVKCGFSSNEKTATKNEITNSHRLSGLSISKPLLASPAGNVAATSDATRTNNVSETRQESNYTFSNPTLKINVTHLQNNRSANAGAIENKVFTATSGPNKNADLLPTPKMPAKFSPFDFNSNLQIAQPGVPPIMSYASVCAHNINNNHFNRNGQQCTPNNVRFNIGNRVNSANVTQSHSRAEPRPSIPQSSVIKENIQGLLTEHANGLSIFQLQKIYLFKYRQPLKFRGSATLKQLLMELKDVVKTEGVGVQMLVFPAPAQNIQVTAASGDHDAALQGDVSLLTEIDSKKEVALNPHSVDSLKTQNDELQEATQLPLHDGQILASGPYQIDPMEGHITEVVKTENTQPIMQNMQRVERISSNAFHEGSPEEALSVSASDAGVLPNQINDKPQHKTPQSEQMHHQMNKSYVREEMSYLCKNVIMKDTIVTNGPSEIAPQNSYSHRIILHSSSFSFVMGQPIDGSHNKASELYLADTSSVTEQKTPYHSNNVLKGPEHSQQGLPSAKSSILVKDSKPHQLSNLYVENSEHPLLPLHNSRNTLKTNEQTEFPELQQREDFQTAKNCDLTESPPSHPRDNLQTETVLVQTEKPSSIQKDNSQIRKTVEQAAHLPLNRQEKAPNSQITNNRNVVLEASANENTPDAQTKNIPEKKSQQEASLSPHTNDLGDGENTHSQYVHDTEQATHMSSHVHKVPDTHQSETKQNESTLQTKQFDEFTSPEMIPQKSLLTPRQEIADPFQNIPTQPVISVAQSELPNNLDCITDQEDNNKTWQSSQEAACCIL
ncbi:uncharacterized protein LOC130294091 isoform X2 [Hyla sarda]|uniref:uncharacterized protein LOC130294091 isoform X2 n=1 Tax=Hyla sarda TaxID=327740 RepID=UPI0024C417DC|nr:uncharacterized protein LOC130294091 isoform X2 [Hyla sarda]